MSTPQLYPEFMFPALLQDLRHALRILAKSPGFTAVSIFTLALGIGANTAIFTVANAVLLRPLPYLQPERLVLISGAQFNSEGSWGRLSFPFFKVIGEHNRSFSGVAACTYEIFNLTGHGDPEQVTSARASWNLFEVLGVRPVAGRTIAPDEDRPGGNAVVLLSYKFAMRVFGGATNAVGKSMTLDSRDYTVIGVLPAGFVFSLFGPERDVWAARVFDMNSVTPARVAAGGAYFNIIARLRPGISREQAREELDVLYRQYQHESPANFDATLNLKMRAAKLQDELVANIEPTLLILSAAVGFVLLIACANVAGLLLSRALGRRKEFALRTALGGSRARLIRQLLAESMLLAVVSGALGIALGLGGTHLLITLSQDELQTADLSVEAPVLAFTLAVSLISGVLFGLVPALQLSKTDVNAALREEGRGSSGSRRRNSTRSVLVVMQVALSMVLLVGSGLLIRSFVRLRSAPPGFDPQGLLTMQIMLPSAKYGQPAKSIAFYNNVLERLQSMPGVEAAAISTAFPIYATHSTPVLFEGQPAVALGRRPIVNIQQISPDYLKVMRVPLLAGRMFNEHDDAQSSAVVVVNQSAARRFWPHENPMGKRVWIGTMQKSSEVVGVLADTKNNGLASAPQPEVFLPLPQLTSPYISVTLRTAMDPHSLIPAARSRIAAVDPDQPVTDVKTMEEFMESLSVQRRFTMFVLGVFAATALFLALVGLYGVIAYSVAQRRQELGIRMALGAAGPDILRLVIGNGLALTMAGILTGAIASVALTRVMSSLLYQTSARDPITFVASAALFTAVALLASYLPARRAALIDPVEALRAE